MNLKTFDDDRSGHKGVQEWADKSYNICIGCEHGCLYCFARAMRNRFDPTIREPGAWERQRLNPRMAKLGAGFPAAGVVMFPTTHDLTHTFLPQCLQTIQNLLAANEVLVVTKPHLPVIRTLCRELAGHKGKLRFRFTIGALDEELCRFWEPGAPAPEERIAALKWAQAAGFNTSVSIEPMLSDVDQTIKLVELVEPFVTGTIWIGRMQRIPVKLNATVDGFAEARHRIKTQQRETEILRLVALLGSHRKVRWKDSIQSLISKAGKFPSRAPQPASMEE